MDRLLILQAFLAQSNEANAETTEAIPDFRNWVWIAYGAVLVLITIFTLWTVIQVKGAERRMAHLEERLDKKVAAAVKAE